MVMNFQWWAKKMFLQGAPDKNPGIEKVTQKIKLSLSRIPPKNGSLIEVQLIEFSQNTCIHAIFQTQQKTCSFILHPGDSRIMRDFLRSSEVDFLAKSKCHNTSLKGVLGHSWTPSFGAIISTVVCCLHCVANVTSVACTEQLLSSIPTILVYSWCYFTPLAWWEQAWLMFLAPWEYTTPAILDIHMLYCCPTFYCQRNKS